MAVLSRKVKMKKNSSKKKIPKKLKKALAAVDALPDEMFGKESASKEELAKIK